MNGINLFHQDGRPTHVWYCEKCKIVHRSKELADACCLPNICACGNECRQYWTVCDSCRTKAEDAKEQKKFNEAEKLNDWNGPVYSDSLGYNEGYFRDLDQLYEDIDPEDLPEYIWCCDTTQVVSLSLDILNNLEFADGQDESHLVGEKELELALGAFNKANEDVVTWYPNYKKCIIIDKDIDNL